MVSAILRADLPTIFCVCYSIIDNQFRNALNIVDIFNVLPYYLHVGISSCVFNGAVPFHALKILFKSLLIVIIRHEYDFHLLAIRVSILIESIQLRCESLTGRTPMRREINAHNVTIFDLLFNVEVIH